MTLAGAAILVYRRRTVGPVFSATTRNDKIMYVLLIGTIVLGLGTTVLGNLTEHPHDYRETVSPWFRSIFYFQPKPELMEVAPLGFQLHALSAWTLVAFWPFEAGWCTSSQHHSATSRGPTSSTAAVTPNSAAAHLAVAGNEADRFSLEPSDRDSRDEGPDREATFLTAFN